jgi:hypothetical protein
MTAAMLVPLAFPARINPPMPRMNAIGSSTQPTMSAPGTQANTNPTTLTISAISPMVLLRFAGACGPMGGGGGGSAAYG